MKLKNLLLLLFVCLVATTSVSAQKKMGWRTITEKENGKTITIKRGSAFAVLFKKECIGCQHSWEISYRDSLNIKFTSSTYANGPGEGMVGGSQDHTFHFKALKRSRSKLEFVNDDKNFRVTIVVN